MYLLINSDNTINYGNEHPINPSLHMDGLRLIEFPDKTLKEVVGDIKPHEAYWDEETQSVIRCPMMNDEERTWRNREIKRVLNKIDQYERDHRIPIEYRTTKMSEMEYYNLLRYRKELCDYPETNNYALKMRPQLSK